MGVALGEDEEVQAALIARGSTGAAEDAHARFRSHRGPVADGDGS